MERYQTSDFDIQIPREMVAQEPVEPRDYSKMMVIHRSTEEIEHKMFYNLPEFLEKGDTLVFNDSRVIPARLRGNLHGSPMEEIVVVLLNRIINDGTWEALTEVGVVKEGDIIDLKGFYGEVVRVNEKIGKRSESIIWLKISDETKIDKAGEAPIPPYVHGFKGDPERYQTVYARVRGSAAAPTAGLHFTDRLLLQLDKMGVNLCFVTLHVGVDTFMPVQETSPKDHKMYTEFCRVSKEVAAVLNKTRASGHKIVGVGTTSVRTLESSWNGEFKEYSDWTNLYILPGYKFHTIDAMITNFHYPKSTNLIMISALMGLDFLKVAYGEAVKNGYRFYSFGDSTLIL